MARVIESRKAAAVNPLKMSQPLGAAQGSPVERQRVGDAVDGERMLALMRVRRHYETV